MAEPRGLHVHRLGHWLPEDHRTLHEWTRRLNTQRKKRNVPPEAWDETIRDFQGLIETDSNVFELCSSMLNEVPQSYGRTPDLESQVNNYLDMLALLNEVLQRGPAWSDIDNKSGLVGVPLNAILDRSMATLSGYYFFKHPEVNAKLRAILNKYGSFLESPGSTKVLNADSGGWLAPANLALLEAKANAGLTSYSFAELFECPDPSNEITYGFDSWDSFFTRRFRPKIRPVSHPDHPYHPSQSLAIDRPSRYIVNACESCPFRLSTRIKYRDRFWLKGQSYSLCDMLQSHKYARYFDGGTVYQAFLSALSYHRWHAPVSGTVRAVYVLPGTYYSSNREWLFTNDALDGSGLQPLPPDPAAPYQSQPYLSSVATRGVLLLEADDPEIGVVGCVFVGMGEVSSCQFSVAEGQKVRKGDEVGTFRFGGSTHCVLFRPGLRLRFVREPPYDQEAENLPVRGLLATVVGTDGDSSRVGGEVEMEEEWVNVDSPPSSSTSWLPRPWWPLTWFRRQ